MPYQARLMCGLGPMCFMCLMCPMCQARLGVESVLGCVDVGQQAYWWDYGRLELYMVNNLHITEDGPSPHALRTFMKLGSDRQVRPHDAAAAASL